MVNTRLSEQEIQLMGNAGVLLQKKELLGKLVQRLAGLEETFKNILQADPPELPAGTLSKAGKVSKGENYRDLPYLVLDYPRLFVKDNLFNIRLLFWWGHYFSMSLHLAGHIWQANSEKFCNKMDQLDLAGYLLQTKGSPWENDLSSPHFIRLEEALAGRRQEVTGASFIKVVHSLALDEVDQLESFSVKTFKNFMAILKK